jgi:hypothetical protein
MNWRDKFMAWLMKTKTARHVGFWFAYGYRDGERRWQRWQKEFVRGEFKRTWRQREVLKRTRPFGSWVAAHQTKGRRNGVPAEDTVIRYNDSKDPWLRDDEK